MSRYLIDSSVWIDVYRGKHPDLAIDIGDMVLADEASCCGFVLAELLQGAKTEKEYRAVVEDFRGLKYYEAGSEVFLKAAELTFSLRRKGVAAGLIDALIAAVALINDQTILTRDSDFERFPGVKVKKV